MRVWPLLYSASLANPILLLLFYRYPDAIIDKHGGLLLCKLHYVSPTRIASADAMLPSSPVLRGSSLLIPLQFLICKPLIAALDGGIVPPLHKKTLVPCKAKDFTNVLLCMRSTSVEIPAICDRPSKGSGRTQGIIMDACGLHPCKQQAASIPNAYKWL